MTNRILRFLYTSRLGAPFRWLCVRGGVNHLARWWYTSRISRWSIARFIKKHAINMSECAQPAHSYQTFHQFFIRRLKKEARPIDKRPQSISSPSDGSALFIPHLAPETHFYVKQHRFDLDRFVGKHVDTSPYRHGSMLLIRLAPHDYHRFHMPIAGSISDHGSIGGRYETVNPVSYHNTLPLLTNRRHCFELRTATGQSLLLVAVGSLCVASIVPTYNKKSNYLLKGTELGYFAFGGSALALIAPPNSITIRTDILRASQAHTETIVQMGAAVSQWRIHTTSFHSAHERTS